MITVRAAGPLSTIQDRGRHGLRHLGVPRAGVLVPAWMTLANALVGNAADAPVIECFEGGLRLVAGEHELRLAHVGDADVVQELDGERRALAPWRSHRVPPGAEIAVRGTGRARLGVLAVRGLSVAPVLGSASTYARAALGGTHGRALAARDELSVAGDGDTRGERPDARAAEANAAGPPLCCEPFEPPLERPVLHAVPGPQDDAFEARAVDAFFEADWTLSDEVDRMGARLRGPALAHRDAASRDIVSDAIVPGSVQVPGDGRPIVMLADAHTAGGYPKIATIATADLAALAVHRPGTPLRLVRVDVETAIAHARARAAALARHLGTLRPAAPDLPDTARLLAHNLVDGVTDGISDERADDPPRASGRTDGSAPACD